MNIATLPGTSLLALPSVNKGKITSEEAHQKANDQQVKKAETEKVRPQITAPKETTQIATTNQAKPNEAATRASARSPVAQRSAPAFLESTKQVQARNATPEQAEAGYLKARETAENARQSLNVDMILSGFETSKQSLQLDAGKDDTAARNEVSDKAAAPQARASDVQAKRDA